MSHRILAVSALLIMPRSGIRPQTHLHLEEVA